MTASKTRWTGHTRRSTRHGRTTSTNHTVNYGGRRSCRNTATRWCSQRNRLDFVFVTTLFRDLSPRTSMKSHEKTKLPRNQGSL